MTINLSKRYILLMMLGDILSFSLCGLLMHILSTLQYPTIQYDMNFISKSIDNWKHFSCHFIGGLLWGTLIFSTLVSTPQKYKTCAQGNTTLTTNILENLV